MFNSHFIDVLKTLNPNELPRLRDFIASPYFNKRKKVLDLFDVMADYYPFFTDANFSRENIFAKIYPGEAYNYAKINEGLSALYKLSILYIKQSAYEKDNVYSDVSFLEELRKRSLKNIFQLQSRKISSKIYGFDNIDSNLFLKQYLLQIEKVNFATLFGRNNRKEKIQTYISDLSKIAVSLTNFYIAELISISVNNFNYSSSYNNSAESLFEEIQKNSLFKQLSEIIKPYNKFDSYLNLLNCYFEAIYDLKNKKKYYEYKKRVFENLTKMSKDDIGYHLNCLKSYCLIKKKSVSDGQEFIKEYLLLQETILEKNLFATSKSNFFLKEHFLNMLINYDLLKNKNKIKALLQYLKYLHPDAREDMKNLTEAYYYFGCYSYEKVFKCLKKIHNVDKMFEQEMRNLEVRSFYEKESFVECIEKINLVRKQLRLNKFLGKKKIESEMKFLATVEKLVKVNESHIDFDAEYLKNKIEKDEFIPSKEWLIEKCYELYEKPKQIYKY